MAVGGTTLRLDSASGWSSEIGWSGSGGGVSTYESRPSYQAGVPSLSPGQRLSPDVAYDADPATGFGIYDSYQEPGFFAVGGTSAGAPQWAALVAIADQGRALAGHGSLDGPSETLPMLYQMPAANYHDITTGNNGYSASPGFDLVTGRGAPMRPS